MADDAQDMEAILRDILEGQIHEGEPPETKATFDRLLRLGIAEAEVWRMLSAVLLEELNTETRDSRSYDIDAYARRLRALPGPQ